MDVILFLISKFDSAIGRLSNGNVPSDARMVQNCPGRGVPAALSIANSIIYIFSQHGEFEMTFDVKCFMEYINIVGFYCKGATSRTILLYLN